jgi:NADH-quinone oxidoreductase subunit A
LANIVFGKFSGKRLKPAWWPDCPMRYFYVDSSTGICYICNIKTGKFESPSGIDFMEPVVKSLSETFSPWEPGLFSMAVYFIVIAGLLAVILFLAGWLGVKNRTTEKRRSYESGIIPTGLARFAYPVPFYLVAVFFLIFDVEAVYIFSWAVAYESLGWKGWLQISFFIIVLLISLFYIWKKGGLSWGPVRKK